jgi:glycosyltransferase involved in cell wall biosynthesis
MSTDYKIICEKEYNKLNDDKPTIALLMMVKNESLRLQYSLDSVTGIVDCFIIFDTGSTDNTLEIIQNHCEKHKINLYLIQGGFINFCESRNVSLEYGDKWNVKYLLLLDCNDELRGGEHLKKFAQEQLNSKSTGYLSCQEWFSGKYDKYFNIRFVKNRSGWRYRGRVHEWMKNTSIKEGEDELPVIKMPGNIVLYQDRTVDDDKSANRFQRDYELLLRDHKENKTDTRTLFYLAQTCACLNNNDEALYYYKLRTKVDGFQEEKFHAYLRYGEISQKIGHTWENYSQWYLKALEHSMRSEPLIKLTEYYISKKRYEQAYMFIHACCELNYPEHLILFVDKHSYQYVRWHLMGIVGYYANRFKEGYLACKRALEVGINEEFKKIDTTNLEFYEKKFLELNQILPEYNGNTDIVMQGLNNTIGNSNTGKLTKIQYINQIIKELQDGKSTLTIKQITKIANTKWKKRNNIII